MKGKHQYLVHSCKSTPGGQKKTQSRHPVETLDSRKHHRVSGRASMLPTTVSSCDEETTVALPMNLFSSKPWGSPRAPHTKKHMNRIRPRVWPKTKTSSDVPTDTSEDSPGDVPAKTPKSRRGKAGSRKFWNRRKKTDNSRAELPGDLECQNTEETQHQRSTSKKSLASKGMKLLAKPLRSLKKKRRQGKQGHAEMSHARGQGPLHKVDEADTLHCSDEEPQHADGPSSNPAQSQHEPMVATKELSEPVIPSTTIVESEQIESWEPPKVKKRKPKKPKHGDDSVIIGMIITFDPTSELLDLGPEPQSIAKTALKKLQKFETYSTSLLGGRDEDEESTEKTPSVSDFLGFHLDSMVEPFERRVALDSLLSTMIEPSERETPMESILLEKQQDHAAKSQDEEEPMLLQHERFEEEEIVFVNEDEDDEEDTVSHDTPPGVSKGLDMPVTEMELGLGHSNNEEIEIVFFQSEDLQSFPEERSVASTKFTDCHSHFSDHSPLPMEWMLPQGSALGTVSISDLVEEEDDDEEEEAPAYEWFHPDHLDVELPKQHAPRSLFDLANEAVKAVSTPTTMAESISLSFDVDDRSLDYSEEESNEVLSTGSNPADAVQTLLQLCQA